MAFTFDAIYAVDPNNTANIAKNASITIFDPSDPAQSPIAITDPTGSPLPNPITVDAAGMGPAFQHPTLARVGWKGAGFTNYFTSYEGMFNETVAAKNAAQAAASDASTAGVNAAAVASAALAGAVYNAEAAATSAANAAALVGAPADTAIAAAINGNGETRAALKATFAPTQRPTSVSASAALAAPYDAARNTYSLAPRHLRKARVALAAAKAGTGRFKWLMVGDSNTRGVGADKATTSYPAHAQKALAADPGLVLAPADNRWKLTGFMQQNPMRFTSYTNVAGVSAVFSSDTAGTVLDYYYNGQTAAHTITIDGGAPITIPASSTTGIKVHTVTGLTDTVHTVRIDAAAAWVYFFGIDVHDGKGISITNAGISGSNTTHWVATENDAPQKVAAAWAPHLTTINLGTNDLGNAVPLATYEANLTTLVTLYRATGDVVLCAPIPKSSGDDIKPYIDVIYRVADAMDVPVVDLHDRWGNYTVMNALGFYSDTLHGTPTSFADVAAALVDGLGITPGGAAKALTRPSLGVPDPALVWTAANTPGLVGQDVQAIPEIDNHLFATTGNAVVQETGGRRWLDFGTDASTTYEARKVLAGGTAATLVMVARWSAAPTATLQLMSLRGTHQSISVLASGRVAAYGGGSATTFTAAAPAVDTWHRIIAVVNGASSSITVNGVTVAGTTDAVTNAQAAPKLNGTSQHGTDIAAAGVINRVVTAAEIAAIDAALQAYVPA